MTWKKIKKGKTMRLTISVNTHDLESIQYGIKLLNQVRDGFDSSDKESKPSNAEAPASQKSTKGSEPIPTPTPAKKVAKKVTEKTTLAELKTLAKSVSDAHGRETVLSCIKQYAEKLSEVAESDYTNLKNDLTDIADEE